MCCAQHVGDTLGRYTRVGFPTVEIDQVLLASDFGFWIN